MGDDRTIEIVEYELADMQDLLTYASSPDEIQDISNKIRLLVKELNALKKSEGITDELDIEMSLPDVTKNFVPKPQGAKTKEVFSQIDKPLKIVDSVKAINKSRKVYTPEYHNAMMHVIDVGGPMPK